MSNVHYVCDIFCVVFYLDKLQTTHSYQKESQSLLDVRTMSAISHVPMELVPMMKTKDKIK